MFAALQNAAKDFLKTTPVDSRIDIACHLSKYINFIAASSCVDYNLKISDLVCKKCLNTGMNHGVQVTPSKAHPTGWKSEKCKCKR